MQNAITTCNIFLQRALIKHYFLKAVFFQYVRFSDVAHQDLNAVFDTNMIKVLSNQVFIHFELNQ